METLLYSKRLACWPQQKFCAEYWTPKATGCRRVTYVEEVEEVNKQQEHCENARQNNIAETEDKIRRDNLGENQVRIAKMLVEELQAEKIEHPPNLRKLDREKVKPKIREVDNVIKCFVTDTLEHINNLLKATAFVVAKGLGIKPTKGFQKKNHGGKEE